MPEFKRTLLLLPYLGFVILFLGGPLLVLVQISFARPSPLQIAGSGFTTGNYLHLLDRFHLSVLLQTVALALLSTLIVMVLAYPLAYLVARSTGAAKSALVTLATIPLMTSVIVKALGWYIAMGPNGPINRFIALFGVPTQRMLGSSGAVLVGLVEFSLPFMVLTVASAIERIPRVLEEAAANLGRSPIAVLCSVVLPLSRPGLISGCLLCFGVSASAYVVPAMLGGTAVRMAAQQVFDEVMVVFNWPSAAALSVLLVIGLGGVVAVALRLGGGALRGERS